MSHGSLGGRSRRFWLEVGPRRGIPIPEIFVDALGVCGKRSATLCYDGRHVRFVGPSVHCDCHPNIRSVRTVRISVSIKPRLHCHRHDGLLDVFWRVGTLAVLQNVHSLIFRDCRVSGYISSRVYTSLGGGEKRKLAFLTATILPT